MEKNRYEFNKEKHIHTLDDKPLMGVTTVLSIIAKPQLIQWASNVGVAEAFTIGTVEGLAEEIAKYPKIDSNAAKKIDVLFPQFKIARTAHLKKKEKAGGWGTILHKAIEKFAKSGELPTDLDEMGNKAFKNFSEWALENKVEFVESERHIWSEELWVGGICDLVIMMNGKKYIADIKTSSGIYNEAFFQMGAYNLCLEEMGDHKDVAGYIVINLKKDGVMDLKMATDMEMNKQAFKSALSLYKIIKSLK